MVKIMNKIKKIGLLRTLDDVLGNRLSFLRYCYCKLLNKTYFGSYCAATQGKVIRHHYMQRLIHTYIHTYIPHKLHIIELGAWAGGSAITLAEAIKKYYNGKGMVLCVDSWTDYIDTKRDNQWTHIMMKNAFKQDRILKLFLHNVLASKHSDIISYIRGYTDEIYYLFKENAFDIVFIDANHSYDFIKKDISMFATFVKEGGILCGDDLELQYKDVDAQFLNNFKTHDVITDPSTQKRYHPGVTLAVYEYFKTDVSVWEGFWAMQKTKTGWKTFCLKEIGEKEIINIPEHLRSAL